ncbi:conserved hypothetical protein [Desulfamplus magnetovallimortis]|uniref:Uncharacterized protein n=1 Tax=Desulfamplus magnetovallimortis TaxID=1246637 RepID=A0A1W1H807_9BACT|nr:hypothetical protein [Desulfamplus magnetovallimortis]SLM28583.1 conserved hypothetical protein [Desulfamplus magnetovallimortis]
MITLDQAIDTVNQLPAEQQEVLFDIFYHRKIEKRRKEIAEDAKNSIADFHAGRLKTKPVKSIISELAQTLDGYCICLNQDNQD